MSKILLVDDDPAVRESLRRVLSSENYQVALASNGLEAVHLFAGGNIDLVLLDLNLPGKSGWEVIEQIRETNPNLPVVIITAQPHQGALAMAAGANFIMEKPLDLPFLLAAIIRLITEAQNETVIKEWLPTVAIPS